MTIPVTTGMVTRFELCMEYEEMVVGRVQFRSFVHPAKFCIKFALHINVVKMEVLKALYAINSKSGREGEVKRFVLERLKDFPLNICEDHLGNLFITKGEAEMYPCVTAHLDEVHEVSPFRIVEEGTRIWGGE